MALQLYDATEMVTRYLRTSGGSVEANLDFSLAVETFEIAHDGRGGHVLALDEISVLMVFNDKIDVTYYGPIDGGLTNGIGFFVQDADAVRTPLLDADFPIKDNADIVVYSTAGGSAQITEEVSQNSEGYINAVFAFSNASQALILRAGESLQVDVNDDFSALIRHRFSAKGRYIPSGKISPASAGGAFTL